jgi:hypothetical protein
MVKLTEIFAQVAGLTLEEIAATFGDHVAVEFSSINVDQVSIEKVAATHLETQVPEKLV